MSKDTFLIATALVFSICPTHHSFADGWPVTRHAKKASYVCEGPKCGPYMPCDVRCRIACPDPASCYSLYIFQRQYGPYEPYGGVAFWGRLTQSGWIYRRPTGPAY
jgi:hypothetical protein